jgi:hypothetical protein
MDLAKKSGIASSDDPRNVLLNNHSIFSMNSPSNVSSKLVLLMQKTSFTEFYFTTSFFAIHKNSQTIKAHIEGIYIEHCKYKNKAKVHVTSTVFVAACLPQCPPPRPHTPDR